MLRLPQLPYIMRDHVIFSNKAECQISMLCDILIKPVSIHGDMYITANT